MKKRILTMLLVAVMAVTMLTGVAFAAMNQTQIITQVIWEPTDSSVAGLEDYTKPKLLVNTMDAAENMVVIATVTVEVGVGKAPDTLTLTLDSSTTTLYDSSLGGYGVVLTSLAVDNPMGEEIVFSLNSLYGPTTASKVLTVEGVYIFTEIAGGMAGPVPGTANVKVDISLN